VFLLVRVPKYKEKARHLCRDLDLWVKCKVKLQTSQKAKIALLLKGFPLSEKQILSLRNYAYLIITFHFGQA